MMFSASELVLLGQQYYWPFIRFSALFLAAPVFSASSLPVRVRVLLALLVTVLVTPTLPEVPSIDILGGQGVLWASQQVLIGVAMGFTLQLVFAAGVIAGQAAAMAMGLGFAMSVDPQNGVQVPVLSQFYVILATLLFLAIDGHLILIQILSDSFSLLPVGDTFVREGFAMDVVLWGSQMFLGALVIALPALTALLLINLAFGVITRAAPQLNIFAVGFPVTILAGFVFVFLSMPAAFKLFQRFMDQSFNQLLVLLG